jgi:hypothetical protein
MVYVQAAKKTGAYMTLALIVSLAIVTFISGDLDPAGRVTSTGIAPQAAGASWVIFLLGIFVGGLVIGTYFYIVHLEAKRHE